jgi:preprotein translocase subunit SecE
VSNYSAYIWIGILAVVIAILWRKGQLVRLRDYVRETREELKKCTWPTWNELKGSTIVVVIAIGLLGAFTFAADAVFSFLVSHITT